MAAWALVVLRLVRADARRAAAAVRAARPGRRGAAAIGRLWTEYDLLGNVFKSWWRIAQAFCWSALVAIPLGLLMGSFPWLLPPREPDRRAHAVHADHGVPARVHRAVRHGRRR